MKSKSNDRHRSDSSRSEDSFLNINDITFDKMDNLSPKGVGHLISNKDTDHSPDVPHNETEKSSIRGKSEAVDDQTKPLNKGSDCHFWWGIEDLNLANPMQDDNLQANTVITDLSKYHNVLNFVTVKERRCTVPIWTLESRGKE